MRALHAHVFGFPQGVLEPPRTSDCTIVDVSGGLGSAGCEAPSPVLVVSELWGLVFQLERPTSKHTGVCVRSVNALLVLPKFARAATYI